MKTLVDSQDYIIFTDDLRIDSVLTIPMRGDRIIDGLLTFEVMPIDGENCFRPVDGHRQQLRIYVKLVEEQSA